MNDKKIIDYDILTSSSKKELIEKVQETIKEGWQPQGGVSVLYTTSYDYTQAMVKYEN